MQVNEQLHKIRHSLAHIMAAAIQKIKPEANFGVGPAIDNGFYYDFMVDKNFSEDELSKIEKEMRTIIGQKLDFEREEWPIEQAIEYFRGKGQDFKVELLDDLRTKGTTAVADAVVADDISLSPLEHVATRAGQGRMGHAPAADSREACAVHAGVPVCA